MKLKLTIPQVLCRNVTHPRTDNDEIYLCYYISLARATPEGKTEVRKSAVKKLSAVKYHVKKGKVWNPEIDCIIDTGDSDSMIINFGLYEYDSGDIYKKLKETSDILLTPEDFDWSSIDLPVDFTNVMAWVKSLWKLAVSSWNYFKQDDKIGEKSFAVASLKGENKDWLGSREFKFKNYGGDYRLTINLEEVK